MINMNAGKPGGGTCGKGGKTMGLGKRAAALLCAAWIAVCCTGCDSLILGDTDALMRPPRPTGDKAGIHELLEQTAGANFTFKYPASGDNRSAIIMQDLTGDGTQEAIALYEKEETSSTGVNIMFIHKQDGVWTSMGSFASAATQVDRVLFGDVNGDFLQEAVVGWGSGQSGVSSVSVFSLTQGEDGSPRMAETKLEQSYSRLLVMDFDGDGADEIFTATVSMGEQPAQARLLRMRGGAIELLGSCAIDSAVTSLTAASGGLLGPEQPGVLLDGAKATNTFVTEVVYWDQKRGTLVSPFLNRETQTVETTQRSLNITSRDINGDKILEIPMVNLLPGTPTQNASDTAYLTDWHQYDAETNTLVRVMSTVTNSTDGYWFLIPDMWKDQITTEQDVSDRSLCFKRWIAPEENRAEGSSGVTLLEICVFTADQWSKEQETDGYFQILTNNNLIYAGRIPFPDNSLAMSENDVRNSFKLITQE